ncbi:MAG: shikimate dehydrogenase [Polyangiaceae bacterium]|nr:shikimate dehydrogenase [Polyangiaceae bacterium]
MHRAGYAALGLDYAYVPFGISSARLPAALEAMRALGVRGLGVSMPFKLEVLPLLDALDADAARIGACNTVVNDGGRLTGYNTDAPGALAALREVMEPRGTRIVVLGAGGAARAIVVGLALADARVTVVNRDDARASALAAAASAATGRRVEAEAAGGGTALATADALVNATSVGMTAQGLGLPVDAARLRPSLVVMDAVYDPTETPLVAAARHLGAPVVHGGRMLLHQAAGQFELYTGAPAPLASMDAALRAALAP